MTWNDTDDGVRPLGAEAHPVPILKYGFTDGEPVIRGTDGTFRSEFDGSPVGEPVTEGLAQLGVTPVDADLTARISRGEAFEFEATVGTPAKTETNPLRRYRATVIPDLEEPVGHIVFGVATGRERTERTGIGLDHVASVVSHDLRNPLEVAKTRLRAGRESGDEDHFDHVARAHDRMERIIEDVLTLARGEDTIDPAEEAELTGIAETAWESVETDGATLTVDDELPTAVVDTDRTERVFENLFRNAVEHGSTGPRSQAHEDSVEHSSTGNRTQSGDSVEHGSTGNRTQSGDAVEHGKTTAARSSGGAPEGTDEPVEVRVGPIEASSTRGFYVADDGPGIPDGEREAVLQPGYSAHEHGTGLGLAIVDQIAGAHGWTLRITAADTGGARIELRDI